MKDKINDEINKIKKELYIKASTPYFDEKGFKNFKISELAKVLETSVGTIYNLFNSKEEFYLEYLILKLNAFINKLNENKTTDPLKNIENYLKYKYETFIHLDKEKQIPITNDPYFFHKLDILNHPIVHDIYKYLEEQFRVILPNCKCSYFHLSVLFKKFSDGFIESYIIESYDTSHIVEDTMGLFLNGIKIYEK